MEKQKITPCLWFNDNAEEAAKFYTTLFKNSKIKGATRYTEATAKPSGQPVGSVMTTLFELDGFEVMGLNGGLFFKFTPAVSFFVACENEAEINSLWEQLSAGGKVRFSLQKYPFAEKYAWCEDRFGLSWQLILSGKRSQKISPALLFTQEQLGKAEEALNLYTSLFENSKIETMARDQESNLVLHARFSLAGQDFVAMEGPLDHPANFTPAFSLMVNCENQAEMDSLTSNLSSDPKAEQCGWVKDPFGFSWQIVPKVLVEMMLTLPKEKSERVMDAVMKMKKLNIDALKQAAQN